MHDTDIMSKDPVVRVVAGTWSRIVDVDGIGLKRALSFEREVCWLREAYAHARLVDNIGRIAALSDTFCDAGPFLDCIVSALSSARRMAVKAAVGSGPLRVEVRTTVVDTPVIRLPRAEWDADCTPPRYRRVPADWIAHGNAGLVQAWLDSPPAVRDADWSALRYLGPVTVLDEAMAWRTGLVEEKRATLLRGVMETALAGVPPGAAEVSRSILGKAIRDMVPA